LNLLILDTSTDKPFVAFSQGNKLLLNFLLPSGSDCSRSIMETIEVGFKHLNMHIANLHAIAVGVGPGSYTGIRVGAAVAYGLAFAKKVPLIDFCSLESFIPETDGLFVSIIDARLSGVYILPQEKHGDSITWKQEPQFIPKEQLDLYLEKYVLRVGPHLCDPNPTHIAYLAARRLERGEYKSELKLNYLRVPQY
jgi:tRNA threonylcarbamoyl adenosine modification protein YeaZ